DARLLKLPVEIAEAAGLLGAPRRVVLGIEIDDDVFALEVAERDVLARCVLQREVWRFLALDDRHALSFRQREVVLTISCSSASMTGERARSMKVRSSSTSRRPAARPVGGPRAAARALRLSTQRSATPSYGSGPPRPRRSASFTSVSSV